MVFPKAIQNLLRFTLLQYFNTSLPTAYNYPRIALLTLTKIIGVTIYPTLGYNLVG